MKNKVRSFLSAIFLLAAFSLNAQEKKTISLRDAIELSLKSSKQLQNSKAKIDEAVANAKEQYEKKLPSATVSASYLRLAGADFDLKTKSNNSSGSGGGSIPTVNQAMYGILSIGVPIYTGGRIRYGIESATYLAKAAVLDAENDKDAVIQNAIEAFANLFKAHTAVGLVQQNLTQSQQRAKDLGDLEKNGLLARNDLLKAELQSSNIELNLLDAQNNFQLATVNMDLMLGLPTSTELSLDTSGIEKKDDNRVLDDYIQLALKNRKDMQALEYRRKSAEAGIGSAKSDRYPNIEFTGGYIAADIPKVLSITNAVNFGLGFSYNIASLWKTKTKVQEAEARVKQMSASEGMLDDEVRLQISKNYFSLLSNRKKIDVYTKAVEQANENYRIVKNKFDNNLATLTDLLDADVAQLQATLSYTLARADTFVAYNKLLQTAGVLSAGDKK